MLLNGRAPGLKWPSFLETRDFDATFPQEIYSSRTLLGFSDLCHDRWLGYLFRVLSCLKWPYQIHRLQLLTGTWWVKLPWHQWPLGDIWWGSDKRSMSPAMWSGAHKEWFNKFLSQRLIAEIKMSDGKFTETFDIRRAAFMSGGLSLFCGVTIQKVWSQV